MEAETNRRDTRCSTYIPEGFRRSSWTEANAGLPVLPILALASNGQDLYAGAFSEGVYRSTNNGMSWFSASNGLPDTSYVSFLVADSNRVFAGMSMSGVYYSSDYGANWNDISQSIPYYDVWTLALIDSILFVGSIGEGVFLTKDNGITWTQVNEGLTNLSIRSLMITDNNYLFAGTNNGFVCYRPLVEMITDVRNDVLSPAEFILSQNYPNPFNPVTRIKYNIPVGVRLAGGGQAQYVKLTVFDMLGREVEILVNERKAPGNYEVEFDASNLSSGVYFYRLQAGDFINTKKMILLK